MRSLPFTAWIRLFYLIVCLTVNSAAAETLDGKVMSFGIMPQQSARKLAEHWGPLLREVSKRSGIRLRFRTAPDIPTFQKRLSHGEFDFAYINPYDYTVYHQSVGYQAFAKAKDTKLQGIIVVRKDSPYRSLNDLAGQILVFPAPTAFAATLLTQAEFASKKIPITPVYATSHDSVYRAVQSGRYVAGGGIERTLHAMGKEIGSSLRILTKTEAYTPHAFAAHPRVGLDDVERIEHAFESLNQDEIGRNLLAAMQIRGIISASDTDWNDVRQLTFPQINTDSHPSNNHALSH